MVAPTVAPTESASCFAGSETVLLEKGETVPILALKVGDRVLAADINGKATFSEIVAVPHGLNNDRKVFSQIRTVTGRDIKLTPNHIILSGACNAALPLALVKADDVKVGSYVQSVDGRSRGSCFPRTRRVFWKTRLHYARKSRRRERHCGFSFR